jgi:hypothetical protein
MGHPSEIPFAESIAIDNERYLCRDIPKRLGVRAAGRSVVSNNGTTVLKEPQSPYGTLYTSKEDLSCQDNA